MDTTTSLPTVTLSYVSSEALPSQDGQRGRPRVRGRATVIGAGLNRAAVQRALAEQFACKASHLTPYPRETDDGRLTFVIPGLDRDTRMTFAAAAPAAVEAAPSEDIAVSEPASDDAASETASQDDAPTTNWV